MSENKKKLLDVNTELRKNCSWGEFEKVNLIKKEKLSLDGVRFNITFFFVCLHDAHFTNDVPLSDVFFLSSRYKWIKNGKDFEWQAYDDRMSQQPGRGTLVITAPRDEDLGQYQCFAINEHGTATSNSVFVRKAELNSFKDDLPKVSVNALSSAKCSF